MKNVLLLSNSQNHGQPYLAHALPWIKEHFKNVKTILFVPYALQDHDKYSELVSSVYAQLRIKVISAHTSKNPVDLLNQVDGIHIGGGNTFRLLKMLYDTQLLHAIYVKVVKEGMPYVGASAGTNVACATIQTTNDMPIAHPPLPFAIGLVNFQINPHYLDPDPHSIHQGETREQRLAQYHEEHQRPVVGLREGSALKITGERVLLLGNLTARIFRQGMSPIEVAPNSDLADILSLEKIKLTGRDIRLFKSDQMPCETPASTAVPAGLISRL
jgi:dipeptidase E